jgi:predicted RNA-binding protein associated with RNAse of E/G family
MREYRIQKTLERRQQNINDEQRRMAELYMDIGRAEAYATIIAMLDKCVEMDSIRTVVDRQLELLDLDELEFYIEHKNAIFWKGKK